MTPSHSLVGRLALSDINYVWMVAGSGRQPFLSPTRWLKVIVWHLNRIVQICKSVSKDKLNWQQRRNERLSICDITLIIDLEHVTHRSWCAAQGLLHLPRISSSSFEVKNIIRTFSLPSLFVIQQRLLFYFKRNQIVTWSFLVKATKVECFKIVFLACNVIL